MVAHRHPSRLLRARLWCPRPRRWHAIPVHARQSYVLQQSYKTEEMIPHNDQFNPLTEEDLRRMEEDEEFRRRVRNEVLRMQSGEADEDIERDREEEELERQQEQEREQRERKRRSALTWQIFSGSILTSRQVAGNYRYLVIMAFMCLLSIMVMFWSLYTDMQHSHMEREVQLLRERSIRLQEQLYNQTTHQAIRDELARRGMNLQDPHTTKAVVED